MWKLKEKNEQIKLVILIASNNGSINDKKNNENNTNNNNNFITHKHLLSPGIYMTLKVVVWSVLPPLHCKPNHLITPPLLLLLHRIHPSLLLFPQQCFTTTKYHHIWFSLIYIDEKLHDVSFSIPPSVPKD